MPIDAIISEKYILSISIIYMFLLMYYILLAKDVIYLIVSS